MRTYNNRFYSLGKYPGDLEDTQSYAVCNSDEQKAHLDMSGQLKYQFGFSTFYQIGYLASYVDGGKCGNMSRNLW